MSNVYRDCVDFCLRYGNEVDNYNTFQDDWKKLFFNIAAIFGFDSFVAEKLFDTDNFIGIEEDTDLVGLLCNYVWDYSQEWTVGRLLFCHGIYLKWRV